MATREKQSFQFLSFHFFIIAVRYIRGMRIELIKASGRALCRSEECKKLPEYVTEKGRIKTDTTCVAITMGSAAGWNTSYYCRDCVDKLYLDIKKILNIE